MRWLGVGIEALAGTGNMGAGIGLRASIKIGLVADIAPRDGIGTGIGAVMRLGLALGWAIDSEWALKLHGNGHWTYSLRYLSLGILELALKLAYKWRISV